MLCVNEGFFYPRGKKTEDCLFMIEFLRLGEKFQGFFFPQRPDRLYPSLKTAIHAEEEAGQGREL